MISRFNLVLRAVPLAVGCVMMIASAAVAQPVDGTEAPAEYQRGVVQPDDPSGTTDEIDAAEAQYDAAQAGDDTGLTRRATGQVEEIVVSARKRAEALEDTPVAVTAVTAGTLREAGVYRVDQVTELVPNLQFQDSIQGNLAQFAIRGVGTGNPDIQFDPGVALYLDGVFLPRASGSLLSVVDVQQIEVLRGPQGTLFGKNSVGGAINITTVKPQHELEGFAMVRPSNFNGLDAEVMLNVPIVEDFLLSRVAFFSAQRDGYVYDSFRDELYSDRNELAFIGSLRMFATDDITLDLTGMWSRSQTRGRAGQCIDVRGPDSGDEAPLAGLYADMFPECRETTLFENTANIAGMSDIKSYGTWGVMNWDVGDAWEIEDLAVKAQGSWNQQIPRTRFDVDNTSKDVVYLSTAGGEDGGVSKFDGAPGFQQQVAGELQVNGAAFDGRLVFVTGLFAQWESMTDDRATSVGPPLTRLTRNVAENSNWTWAPYLQATANFTDWLSLTGGIRYTQDNKSLTLSQFQYAPGPGRPLAEEIQFPRESQLFTAWTPMGSIASTVPLDLLPDWTDHFMAYFTYAQGFKGGGFNALAGPRQQEGTSALAASFDPETLDNFELGFKGIFWENKLTVNTAFFIGKYDDIQKVSVVTDGTGGRVVQQRPEVHELPRDPVLDAGRLGRFGDHARMDHAASRVVLPEPGPHARPRARRHGAAGLQPVQRPSLVRLLGRSRAGGPLGQEPGGPRVHQLVDGNSVDLRLPRELRRPPPHLRRRDFVPVRLIWSGGRHSSVPRRMLSTRKPSTASPTARSHSCFAVGNARPSRPAARSARESVSSRSRRSRRRPHPTQGMGNRSTAGAALRWRSSRPLFGGP